MKQEYTSAKTSIKQIPAGFNIVDKHFGWQPGTINLDIGGGKYDLMTNALKEKGVTNLIYDPYNRSLEHNSSVIRTILKVDGVQTATIYNVLNVIQEREVQLDVIKFAFHSLDVGTGMVFVRSTYMNPTKQSGVTKSGTFQHYLKQKDYLEIVKTVFPNAELKYGIIFAKKDYSSPLGI
jgi:hypothetical protein